MNIAEFLEETRTGGCTVWLTEEKTNGFLVGGACPGHDADNVDDITPEDVMTLIVRASGTANTIGSWINEQERGRVYLDGNTWIPDLEIAFEVAQDRGELAIWDIEGGKTIHVR